MLPKEKNIQAEASPERSVSDIGKELDELQRAMADLGGSLLVIVEGWESSGKGYLITRLRREIDPRYYHVRLFDEPTESEKIYPMEKRFWEELPKKGAIAIFDRSYYSELFEKRSKNGLDETLTFWNAQENMWRKDRMCIIKLFLDIREDTQEKNIRELEKDPNREFLVSAMDKKQNEKYAAYRKHMNDVLEKSNSPCAPWHIVSMEDRDAGTKHAMELCVSLLKDHLEFLREDAELCRPITEIIAPETEKNPPQIKTLDLSKTITDEEYDARLQPLQHRVRDLAFELFTKNRPMIFLFEGTDAAGKGGSIKRLTKHIDPRSYRIHTVAAPTKEELSYHYMHRFVTLLPSDSQIKIFDRSWYDRVLVERIEGFASPAQWQRAYDEINALEAAWQDEGIRIVKFYLSIDKDEQKARFEARESDPRKVYKLTDEDWRNREKFEAYDEAADEMFRRTSTINAPWNLIPANSKRYARIQVLEKIVEEMEAHVK
jgi:polyphosphate:AMP phosphotransferase